MLSRRRRLRPTDAIVERADELQTRYDKIREILAAQTAFKDAVARCSGPSSAGTTMEASVQCLETQWDGASDSGSTIQSGPTTVIVPNSGGTVPNGSGSTRTVEEAIREYKASGPEKPRPRPSGKQKEPPPPGS